MSNKRYMVYLKSGRKFMVEEHGQDHSNWGDIDPATKKLHKVHSKGDNEINESNTEITPDRFKNIVMLNPGTSPLAYIDALDKSGIERFEKIDFGVYL